MARGYILPPVVAAGSGSSATLTSSYDAAGGILSGVLTDPNGSVAGVTINALVDGVAAGSGVTDSGGNYALNLGILSSAAHTITAVASLADTSSASPISVTISPASGYDIVLCVGSQNMLGGAYTYSTSAPISDPRILQFAQTGSNKNTFVAGTDPLLHPDTTYNTAAAQTFASGGIKMGHAVAFAQNYLSILPSNRSIALVPYATLSTGFTDGSWNPGNTMYANAVAAANAAVAAAPAGSRFVGILWLSGETDSGFNANVALTTNEYAYRMDQMIAGLRSAITGAANSWFVLGQMPLEFGYAQGVSYLEIDRAHRDTPRRNARCAMWAMGPNALDTVNNLGAVFWYNQYRQRQAGAFAFSAALTTPFDKRTVPDMPLRLVAGQATSTSQVLVWAWQRTNSAATDAVVQYQAVGSSTWTTFAHAHSSIPRMVVTGLTAGTSYNFRVAAVNAAGQSAWSNIVTTPSAAGSTYLLDAIAQKGGGIWSTRRLVSSYTGPCMRVFLTTPTPSASTPAYMDIGFTSGGALDTGALLSAAGSGSAYVVRWYDQSGNGNDRFNPPGGANGPQIVNAGALNTINGNPALYCSASNKLMMGAFPISSIFSPAEYTLLSSVQMTSGNATSAQNSGAHLLASYQNYNGNSGFGNNVVPVVNAFGSAFLTTPAFALQHRDTGAVQNLSITIGAYPTAEIVAAVYTGGNSTLSLYRRGGTANINNGVGPMISLGNAMTQGYLGPGGAQWVGYELETVAFPSALSVADINTIGASMGTYSGTTWSAAS